MKKVRIETVEFDKAVRNLEDESYERFGNTIHFNIDKWFNEAPINVTISWASIGAKNLDETEDFARKLQEAVELAESFPYNGAMPCWDEEIDEIYYEIEIDDTDEDDDIIDHDIEDDTDDEEEEFFVETEITADTPRDWHWFDSVIIVDKHNRESGIYESEGREAEYAAFEAISLIEDIKDDTIKSEDETEAMGAYENQLDAVARVMSYNEVLQKYCLDDILPRLSIKVTMHMIPNDGEFYDDEETIMAVCDDINGAMVYDDKHPSNGISMTCKEWKLVEDKVRTYGLQADSSIIDALING